MPKNNLPTYAIVELLIRLEKHCPTIGDYKNHTLSNDGVVVKTTRGSIKFAEPLIKQQFESPELITDEDLARAGTLFKAVS